jgi:hypothetical protein
MSSANKVGQTSRTGTCAAVCSLNSSVLARPIGRRPAYFFPFTGNISKQYSSVRNELYLFVGGISAFGRVLPRYVMSPIQCAGCGGAVKVPGTP